MQVWTDEKTGRVNWLREKHYGRKVGREGFSTPAKSGNGNKKRNKKKASEAMKKIIAASQPKMMMFVNAKGQARMIRLDKA